MNKWERKSTICWHCLNAVPNSQKTRGCSWSRHFIPVEGWEAEKTNIFCQRWNGKLKTHEDSGTCSYIVRSCPEFIPDGRKDEE